VGDGGESREMGCDGDWVGEAVSLSGEGGGGIDVNGDGDGVGRLGKDAESVAISG